MVAIETHTVGKWVVGILLEYCLFHHISTDTFLPAIVSTTDLKAILMTKFYCSVMENITVSMVKYSSLQEFAGKHPSVYVECLVWT